MSSTTTRNPAPSYEPVSKQLLPLDHVWQDKLAAMPWPTKNLPEVIEGAASALSGFHSRIPLRSAVSGVRRIPCQRKRQPPGGHATRGKEHRRHFGRAEPHAFTGFDRNPSTKNCSTSSPALKRLRLERRNLKRDEREFPPVCP